MAAGDGNAASRFQVNRTEVKDGGRNSADIVDTNSGLSDSTHQSALESRTAQTAVPADTNVSDTLFSSFCTKGLSYEKTNLFC